MGRWAWSSDALDFDSDGWEDLYVANGMLTRERADRTIWKGFFWRQVVARSPLTRVKGTPYDDAWRAMNQLLIHESIASHQRNVFLRNDGQGRLRRRVGQRSDSISIRTADRSPCSISIGTAIRISR